MLETFAQLFLTFALLWHGRDRTWTPTFEGTREERYVQAVNHYTEKMGLEAPTIEILAPRLVIDGKPVFLGAAPQRVRRRRRRHVHGSGVPRPEARGLRAPRELPPPDGSPRPADERLLGRAQAPRGRRLHRLVLGQGAAVRKLTVRELTSTERIVADFAEHGVMSPERRKALRHLLGAFGIAVEMLTDARARRQRGGRRSRKNPQGGC